MSYLWLDSSHAKNSSYIFGQSSIELCCGLVYATKVAVEDHRLDQMVVASALPCSEFRNEFQASPNYGKQSSNRILPSWKRLPVAGTLTCVENDDKAATSNDLICICDGLDCALDESSEVVVSIDCEEGETGKFLCVSGGHFSGIDSFPDKKKRDGIPNITNQNETSEASLKTRRGFSFIRGLCEFFTGDSDKCDKFFEKRDLASATSSGQYTNQ
ncbi:uncharacterized protein EAE97_003948 [Botrytis byssoidea]|uniref:Uncharacterized protein n=1 Tax=Botrytis byssoidea TaxID=139641 RepID=A0A9P5ISK6_9HELO|nr:uncharacterized protein EAE97_003948 [Botrytis byssoidea]KAF7948537.1 hypothetical protein EAE97_003948 [Botrytis byssoidea]